MKKVILLGALTLGVYGAFAQDSLKSVSKGLVSKKGEAYLPEANDWAISFDAVPFLNYAGNLFSGSTTSNTSPGGNWINPAYMTITGKLFKDAKTAYRATVRIGMHSGKVKAEINDATVTTPPVYPNLPAMKEDMWKTSSHYVGLGAGIEMRRGKTRLQGFYGADAMIWMSGVKNKFEYGNALSPSGTVVTVASSTNFGANATSTGSNVAGVTDTYGNAARITEDKKGSIFGFGVRGFIGAEYFIFPKIAIGGEYGWGIGISSSGSDTQTKESMGGSPATVGTQTIKAKKSGGFGFDTDLNGGFGAGTAQLKVTLHF